MSPPQWRRRSGVAPFAAAQPNKSSVVRRSYSGRHERVARRSTRRDSPSKHRRASGLSPEALELVLVVGRRLVLVRVVELELGGLPLGDLDLALLHAELRVPRLD